MSQEYAGVSYDGRCYEAALRVALNQAEEDLMRPPPIHWPSWGAFWLARTSARMTACALLTTARRVGVTEEQWEALRATAAIVAED